ncbi:hypothetical protein [Sphingomonas dokdonensis]|uniref:TraB family protein n=1 Tax=Sphingomonas dokdonensis TaxID=344880 RepID=A0A245ZDP4_9SPHN|nr:hypothetical protein [Sphingomonas dokdonensis]OWK27881.1 hypothetical protein SPDO_29640 [Sphingomonas dokdonensis]
MRFVAVCLLLLSGLVSQVAHAEQAPRTRVIILGVDHGAQLVSQSDQPGFLAAYLQQTRPDAICIERPPEQAARGSYYEYTYEVQGIILPYAETSHTALCPIDWMPSVEDQILGFGLDLDTPLEVRRASGFQGFLSFPDPSALKRDFFAAEDATETSKVTAWAAKPSPRADQDLPRRLYLYRTFMQAQRIRAAAAARPGKTVLVVIGYFHKPDLEAILSLDPTIELVRASENPRPTVAEVNAATTLTHLAAIAAFNILGVQAETGNINVAWLGSVLDRLEAGAPGPASSLLRTRFELLAGRITLAEATQRYRKLAAQTPAEVRFGWTGVEDGSRVDSFFDPYGNLPVRERALVEQARCLFLQGRLKEGHAIIATVGRSLSPRKALQLKGYSERLRQAPLSP